MTSQTIFIILGLVIAALLLRKGTREKVVGICAATIGVDTKKRENKEKILRLFAEAKDKSLAASGPLPLGKGEELRGELSNADIREALSMSDRSVIRYMDELEREGKVEQVGATGRSVSYRLKR